MNRVLTFVLMLAGVLLAGSAYAEMSGPANSSDLSGPTTLNPAAPVHVAIISRTGNSVKLYAPEGNQVLCPGDYVAVYNTDLKVPPASVQPSAAWEALESPGYIFGRNPATFGTELGPSNITHFNKEVAEADTTNMPMIGQVRVDNFVSGNYANGTLITGEASKGDIGTKPSAQCHTQPIIQPQG